MSADTLHRLWEVQDELAAVRAELSALKARRCDGCAHWHGAGDTPDHGWCLPLDGFVGAPDFSCAAWTEKP